MNFQFPIQFQKFKNIVLMAIRKIKSEQKA